jgi:heme/copper-type cytochrome/quinol oxidase subunit 2
MPQFGRASTSVVGAIVAATIVVGTVIAATVIGATFIVLLTVRSAATQTATRAAIMTTGIPSVDVIGGTFESDGARRTNGTTLDADATVDR